MNKPQQHRERLRERFIETACADVRFWIPPDASASAEECVDEVLSAFARFEKDKKSGTAKPAGDEVRY